MCVEYSFIAEIVGTLSGSRTVVTDILQLIVQVCTRTELRSDSYWLRDLHDYYHRCPNANGQFRVFPACTEIALGRVPKQILESRWEEVHTLKPCLFGWN